MIECHCGRTNCKCENLAFAAALSLTASETPPDPEPYVDLWSMVDRVDLDTALAAEEDGTERRDDYTGVLVMC